MVEEQLTMKLSIIVPAYNEEKLLAGSLQAIKTAAGAVLACGWQTEIVVCDNNSTDRTPDIARDEGAVVVFEPVNQISRARNSGAAAATGDWFLFVDADSQPSQELLADLMDAIESGRAIGGGSLIHMDLPSGQTLARLAVKLWNRISRWQRWAAGSFVFCRADIFRELGGFSTELFASEEIAFSRRLKRRASRLGMEVCILHRHPLVTSNRKLHLYGTWEHARFILKNALALGRPLRVREACPIWYDGRR